MIENYETTICRQMPYIHILLSAATVKQLFRNFFPLFEMRSINLPSEINKKNPFNISYNNNNQFENAVKPRAEQLQHKFLKI